MSSTMAATALRMARLRLSAALALAAALASGCDDGGGTEADVGADVAPDLAGDTADAADAVLDAPEDGELDAGDAVAEPEVPDLPPLPFTPHLRGTFNAWEATDPMDYVGGGAYAVVVTLSPGVHEFKIADANWSLDTIYSAHATEQIAIALDAEVPLVIATGFNNNTELPIEEEGEYTFTLAVSGSSGALELVLVVTQGAIGPIDDLPDDSQEETFTAASYEPIALVGGEGMLTPEALFEALAIDIPAGESVQYVYGDNIDGYLEGWTQAYSSAMRYWHRSGFHLSYFATLVDGTLNDVESEVERTRILPYGVRNEYGGGVWDEVILHAGQRAVSLRIHSDEPARLAIIPKLALRRRTTTWTRHEDAMVYALDEELRRTGLPTYMAVAGDRDYSVRGADLEAMPFLTDTARIQVTDVKPLFTTTADETDFRIVLAFGDTADEAAELATALAGRDGVAEHQQHTYDLLTASYLWTDDPTYNRALMWAKLSAYGMVNEELGTGIWAGLPWFKQNWGRDTFISLPGTLLATGRFEEAAEVIRNFAALQNTDPESPDYGRIPNRVAGDTDIIYNTVDGTPWMVRELWELIAYTDDLGLAFELFPVVERYLQGAIDNHLDENGFLTHADADTWMDARFGPEAEYAWSARGDRAIEIQALWYTALRIGAELADPLDEDERAAEWNALADQLAEAFPDLFWDAEAERLADRVRADGSRDLKVRPNQLMLVTVPFASLAADLEPLAVRNAVGELLFPWGIASLSQAHPYFHPHHDNQPTFEKDAAYHNGTVWGWNAGFTVSALVRYGYVDLAYALSSNMAGQLLEMGTRGSLSELVDAHPDAEGDLVLSGTYSQTWSVAEYVRNGYQDYLGFRPGDLGAMELWPAPPAAWDTFHARVPHAEGEVLVVDFARGEDGRLTYEVGVRERAVVPPRQVLLQLLAADGSWYHVPLSLADGETVEVVFDPATGTTNVGNLEDVAVLWRASQQDVIGQLEFVAPNLDGDFPTMEEDDYLRGIVEAGEYE